MTTVVLVEDHEAVRDGLVAVLGARGLDVVGTAGTAAAGVDLVGPAEPDVAIVDVHLPDASGIDLAATLVGRRPGLAVLLYTADPDAALLARARAAGARGFALKTGSADELVDAVRRLAAGGTYVDPRLDAVRRAAPRGARAVLSPREREVVGVLARGATAEGAGATLGVSAETVRTHVRNAVRKLGARNRVHAIALALASGEVTVEPEDGDGDGGAAGPRATGPSP